jgi:hypothetical protein
LALTLYRGLVYVSPVFYKQSSSDGVLCTDEIVGKRIVLCHVVPLQFVRLLAPFYSISQNNRSFKTRNAFTYERGGADIIHRDKVLLRLRIRIEDFPNYSLWLIF